MKRSIRRKCICGCGGITNRGSVWIKGHNANIVKNCLYCGARLELKVKRDMKRKKFCNYSCGAKYGLRFGKMGVDWNDPIKKEKMKNALRKPHRITRKLLMAAKERGAKRKGIRISAIRIVRACECCGKIFFTFRYSNKSSRPVKRYCCIKCKGVASRKLPELRTNKIRLKEWRMSVLARDCHICQQCGCERKRLLQAHHKKSKREYPRLVYKVNNGKTLCVYCHIKQHPHLKNFILSSLGIKLKQPHIRIIKRRERRLQDAKTV